ncbi:hypothetical protein GCM10010532_026630 [Dactylosporangium siamense]|uniref:Uncharacterized protein n=1 Tax=Dactylosporangium siamense TaxID=685454 RepID=A0A919PH77_9ACTN|nr:hypothetical protein Dsi01nite_005560 [Dactylosporangium siamense]
MTTPRRSHWMALLAVTGAVAGGAYAAARKVRTRQFVPPAAAPTDPPLHVRSPSADPPTAMTPSAAGPFADEPPTVGPLTAEPSTVDRQARRSLVPMAVGGAVAVVLALAVAVAARPSDPGRTATPKHPATPQHPPAPRQPAATPQPGAGLPRAATAAQPVGLSTAGGGCVTGPDRPVLDTVHPTLSASFTGVPAEQYVQPTFQLRRDTDAVDPAGTLPGEPVAAGRTSTLDLRRHTTLAHGVTYRWRVRGTPDLNPGDDAGWSSWCEFTVAATAPDALDLDDGRTYTVTLPTARWQAILRVLGPVPPSPGGDRPEQAPIEDAVRRAAPGTAQAPVTMTGSRWKLIANDLASLTSSGDGSTWDLVDILSTALGGPPRLTMGFPRQT